MPGRKAHLPEPLIYEKFGAMMQEAGVEHAALVARSSGHSNLRFDGAAWYTALFLKQR